MWLGIPCVLCSKLPFRKLEVATSCTARAEPAIISHHHPLLLPLIFLQVLLLPCLAFFFPWMVGGPRPSTQCKALRPQPIARPFLLPIDPAPSKRESRCAIPRHHAYGFCNLRPSDGQVRGRDVRGSLTRYPWRKRARTRKKEAQARP